MTGQMTGREALTCLVRATASAGTQVEAGRTLHNLLAERDELAAIVRDPWQPIESAPKTGRVILAWPVSYCPHKDRIGRVWWGENRRTGTTYWRDCQESDDYENESFPPTHWMPMPIPPRADQ